MNLAQAIDAERVRGRELVAPRVMKPREPDLRDMSERTGSVDDILATLRGNSRLTIDELFIAAGGRDRKIFVSTLSYLKNRGRIVVEAGERKRERRYSLA